MKAKPATTSPHPADLHVGRRLAARRLTLGFSQSELAQALKLSFQQVQKYEKGANRISSSKLWDAAVFLGVGVTYFFEGLPGTPPQVSPESGPVTRTSLEIDRLSRRLTRSQQRLV